MPLARIKYVMDDSEESIAKFFHSSNGNKINISNATTSYFLKVKLDQYLNLYSPYITQSSQTLNHILFYKSSLLHRCLSGSVRLLSVKRLLTKPDNVCLKDLQKEGPELTPASFSVTSSYAL